MLHEGTCDEARLGEVVRRYEGAHVGVRAIEPGEPGDWQLTFVAEPSVATAFRSFFEERKKPLVGPEEAARAGPHRGRLRRSGQRRRPDRRRRRRGPAGVRPPSGRLARSVGRAPRRGSPRRSGRRDPHGRRRRGDRLSRGGGSKKTGRRPSSRQRLEGRERPCAGGRPPLSRRNPRSVRGVEPGVDDRPEWPRARRVATPETFTTRS